MSKITTEYIKQQLVSHPDSINNNWTQEKKWKRITKYKEGDSIVREFSYDNNAIVYVYEKNDNVEISYQKMNENQDAPQQFTSEQIEAAKKVIKQEMDYYTCDDDDNSVTEMLEYEIAGSAICSQFKFFFDINADGKTINLKDDDNVLYISPTMYEHWDQHIGHIIDNYLPEGIYEAAECYYLCEKYDGDIWQLKADLESRGLVWDKKNCSLKNKKEPAIVQNKLDTPDINHAKPKSSDPFHALRIEIKKAITNDSPQQLLKLFNDGCSTNITLTNGNTIIEEIIDNKKNKHHNELAQVAIENGVSLYKANSKYGDNTSVLRNLASRAQDFHTFIKFLKDTQSHYLKDEDFLSYIIIFNQYKTVEYLIDEKIIPVNHIFNDGETVWDMIELSDKAISQTMNIFLQKGWDLNQKNGSGDTPLFRAATTFNMIYTDWLLDNGANPKLKNAQDKDVLSVLLTTINSKIRHLGGSMVMIENPDGIEVGKQIYVKLSSAIKYYGQHRRRPY